MSSSHASIAEHNASYIGPDSAAGADVQAIRPTDARDLFTRQTGQVLLEIGNMFLHIPPFNEHVDRNTGALLISIGNKLQARK
jgi:hypothetical protein